MDALKVEGKLSKKMHAFKQKMEKPGSGLTLIGPFKQLGPRLKFIRGLALIGFPTTGSCNIFSLEIYLLSILSGCVHEARVGAAAVFQDL